MKKVRRKLTNYYGETEMRTVWQCSAKIGTHSSSLGYFFDEPKAGVSTQFARESKIKHEQMNTKALTVRIDEVQDHDGMILVFASQF